MCRSGNAPPTAFATADRGFLPALIIALVIPGSRCTRPGMTMKLSQNAFELAGPALRPRPGINHLGGDKSFMQSVGPDNTDPIPLRSSPHRMGTIMIRFVGLLFVAVVALGPAWGRLFFLRV